jgi:hypothetical protein
LQALEHIEIKKYIVLEDFHYLPQETQRNFAFNLKAIHENSKLVFIIIGVWRETNRLIALNGDLNNRVISINADAWSETELKEVIALGADLLNISFEESFSTELVKSCLESVYLVQEACAQVCKNYGVYRAQPKMRNIGAGQGARDIVKSIVDQQQDRYMSFLTTFSEGHQHSTLQMYKWLLLPIILSRKNELENGLTYNYLSRIIKRYHPQGAALNPGNLTQALQACVYLQTSKNLTPVIFDYDVSVRKIRVVDRSFLIWLEFQNRRELLEGLNLPADATATP